MTKYNFINTIHQFLKNNHLGSQNAISSKNLESLFSIKGSEVRKYVNLLRCSGVPICSDKDGYFYANSDIEVEATIAQLNSRITKIAKARNGMVKNNEHKEC